MSTINELGRQSDVIVWETGVDVYFCRQTITLVSGTAACKIGQVLALAAAGTSQVSSAAKSGGNTGNGTCVLDATTPELGTGIAGIYTVRCVIAGTNSATFEVKDPRGRVLGEPSFSGSGATFTFSDQIKFVITDAGTDFVVGDGFDITVLTGPPKYTQVTPAATDGSSVAKAVLLETVDPTSADKQAVAIVRGPCALKDAGLVWTSGMTANQKTTATSQLGEAGITVRQALGS